MSSTALLFFFIFSREKFTAKNWETLMFAFELWEGRKSVRMNGKRKHMRRSFIVTYESDVKKSDTHVKAFHHTKFCDCFQFHT